MSACAPPFSLQGFPGSYIIGHISSYRCARNFDIGKWKFFFTFLSCRFITHELTAFSITFLTHFKKDGYTLLGLPSKVFYFGSLVHLYHLDFSQQFNNFFDWMAREQKNRCLIFSANSVGLYFRDREEKIKENGKRPKQKTYKMGRKTMAGKNSRTCTFGPKLQKYYNFFKF